MEVVMIFVGFVIAISCVIFLESIYRELNRLNNNIETIMKSKIVIEEEIED